MKDLQKSMKKSNHLNQNLFQKAAVYGSFIKFDESTKKTTI